MSVSNPLPMVRKHRACAISRAHVSVIAEDTPSRPVISQVEPHLVAMAREHTPHQVGGLVKRVTDAIDGDGGATSDEESTDGGTTRCRRPSMAWSSATGAFDPLDGMIQKTAGSENGPG